MKLNWYPTDLPFLPRESVINNRVFDPQKYLDRPIGELATFENGYRVGPMWQKPAGLKGQHICEVKWFGTGEPWPNDLPPTQYDEKNIPLCCGAFHDGAKGGLMIGGEMGDRRNNADATAGGLMIGGTMGDRYSGIDATAGGLMIGGQAGDHLATTDATAGGVQIGGQAGDLFGFNDPTAGGLMIGGEAGDEIEYTDETEGGVEIGGEMGDVAGVVFDTPGCVTWTVPTTGNYVCECIGAGGGGGTLEFSGSGGGAYAKDTLSLTAGDVLRVCVGVGPVAGIPGNGQPTTIAFNSTPTTFLVSAAGGHSPFGGSGGVGGAVADCIGTTRFKGGNGATATFGGTQGGGGGSSAGFTTQGTDGGTPAGGAAPTGGGDGGNGGATSTSNGVDGHFPGGGGGGGGQTFTTLCGGGAKGWARITG